MKNLYLNDTKIKEDLHRIPIELNNFDDFVQLCAGGGGIGGGLLVA